MAPKGAVCLCKDKIYSKNAKSNSVMEGSLKPVQLPSASGNCFRIASTTHAGMTFLLFLPSLPFCSWIIYGHTYKFILKELYDIGIQMKF